MRLRRSQALWWRNVGVAPSRIKSPYRYTDRPLLSGTVNWDCFRPDINRHRLLSGGIDRGRRKKREKKREKKRKNLEI
ncbi:hypothetical protein B296_00057632 [Ensete ventricosum]|uniref:Uncharacterized protein n=1 Tax=Ensete ventricosum TaxID=4639 RepID=A0A426XM93_ENSVE|nr:hypothetical protein B296_00057632 [Ensete ventricosum]